ncbi:hypothetical protein [Dinghuibacter silviterrae]|uniref:Uncharacterized protein n=1 Tax=Dinghuibacter silviterrae TaxID=1539049 RepID=A0A4R8DPW3_9BACT|nr:hypothetical protein [Dinghuibacter silviterrae]TDX00142.1 hypothetical protein EDB95_1159 [Dinghuibacter silviterrae]
MEERPITEQESLRIIESMIHAAKTQFSEDGHLYLLWGWVVFLCSVTQFILMRVVHTQWHFVVWGLTWVALAYQVIYTIQKRKRRRVKTYADSILTSVWTAFLVALFLMAGVIGNIERVKGMDYYAMVNPLFLLLYGVPTFISGSVLKFKPLIFGGIGCWVLAIVAAFLPQDWQILMLSVAMLIAWISPGYQLRARYRKTYAPDHGL